MKIKPYLRHAIKEEYNQENYDFEKVQTIHKTDHVEIYNLLNKANPEWMKLVLHNTKKRDVDIWDSGNNRVNNVPQYMYRSSKGYHDLLMLCNSPENRGSMSMDMMLNDMVDDMLKKRGCVALRKNSAFCTNSMNFAKQFGGREPGLRIIIPVVGKFHTTYLTNVEDLYINLEARFTEIRYGHDGDYKYLFENLVKIVEQVNKVLDGREPPVYTYGSFANRFANSDSIRKLYEFCVNNNIITAQGEEAFKKYIFTMNEEVFDEMVGPIVSTNNSKELYEKFDGLEDVNKKVELYLTGEYYAIDIDLMYYIIRDKILDKF